MFQILIVVFREVLEIALIVGILTAVTKGIVNRERYILSGLVFGVIGAIILAFAMDSISAMLDGDGQEIFNGVILICASILISWTVIWMQQHAKSLSGELKNLANSIKTGNKSLISLLVVVTLSVLREGSEIVLFTYGYYLTGISLANVALGLVFGLALGATCGFALYFGMLRAFGKYFFKITTWILVFLACTISSQGISFLVNVDLVPAIIDPAWNISHILSQKSTFGAILNAFIGYSDSPSGTQLLVYLMNFTILVIGLRVNNRKLNSNKVENS